MPYRDSFDHKGPLIYFINYLGNCISAYRGVFVIELLMLTVTFAFWYKLARLVCGNAILSAISACCGIYLCYGYFEGGNFTEEYALLFISISLYIFVEYLLLDAEENKKLYLKITICGFCMGAVCMLRINMIAVWIVFCIAIAIRTLINKNPGLFVRFIACFLIGTLICVLPFCMWLAVNGCFGDFIDVYLGFNMMYSKSGTGMGTTMGKVKTFFTFANQNLYLAGIGVCLVIVGKWKKSQLSKVTKLTFFAMTYFGYMIVNLATESMSGVVFGHYGMISAPAVVLPIAILFGICNGDVSLELLELKHTCVGSDNFEIKEERRGRNAGVILLALFLVCYVMAGRLPK